MLALLSVALGVTLVIVVYGVLVREQQAWIRRLLGCLRALASMPDAVLKVAKQDVSVLFQR